MLGLSRTRFTITQPASTSPCNCLATFGGALLNMNFPQSMAFVSTAPLLPRQVSPFLLRGNNAWRLPQYRNRSITRSVLATETDSQLLVKPEGAAPALPESGASRMFSNIELGPQGKYERVKPSELGCTALVAVSSVSQIIHPDSENNRTTKHLTTSSNFHSLLAFVHRVL